MEELEKKKENAVIRGGIKKEKNTSSLEDILKKIKKKDKKQLQSLVEELEKKNKEITVITGGVRKKRNHSH